MVSGPSSARLRMKPNAPPPQLVMNPAFWPRARILKKHWATSSIRTVIASALLPALRPTSVPCRAGAPDRLNRLRPRPWMSSAPMTQHPRAYETLCQRAFADHDLEVLWSSAAQQLQIDGLADAIRPEESHHVPHPSQRLRVPCGNDVTDHKPGARRGAVRVDAHNQDPMLVFQRLRPVRLARETHMLKSGAEISAADISLGQELVDGPVDRRRRDGKYPSAWSTDRHSDHLSPRVDDGTALSPCVEREIKTQKAVDRPPAQALPGAAHEAH